MKEPYIPLSIPNLIGNELRYVEDALRSNWLSSAGPYVNEFEEKLSNYVKSKGAVACQNGTSGIHVSLLALGLERNDEVFVPTLTFIAAVNPVSYIGAKPIFIDCDDSLCISPSKIRAFCENDCFLKDGKLINRATGNKISGIIVVHVFGNMADMAEIMDIAEEYSLFVLEDATEALGTKYVAGDFKDKYAGTIGHLGVYSFNGNKIITTGGGGMIVSDNLILLNKIRHLTTQAKSDDIYFIHDEIGYNYRMTNVQAAIGVAQLELLDKFIEIKISNFQHYKKRIKKLKKIRIFEFGKKIRSNHWFYAMILEGELKSSRDLIIQKLNELGIQVRPVWGLIHKQKPYKECKSYKFENAERFYAEMINIPCSTNLNFADIERVVSTIEKVCSTLENPELEEKRVD